MKIAIIGGGIMGLSVALQLSSDDIHVTVFEKEKVLGGLSRSEEILPDLFWDRYYHAILSTDNEVLELLATLGLAGQTNFVETKTGFYINGTLHSMSTTLEFLLFKPLNIYDKIRLALGIFYSSCITDGEELEREHAETWLVKVFGKRNFEQLWDPLLRSKFGSQRHHTSALLIWATIKRYYGTRRGKSKKERMAYVPGGFKSILSRIQEKIEQNHGEFKIGAKVSRITKLADGQIRVFLQEGRHANFDKVIVTLPHPQVHSLCPQLPSSYQDKLLSIHYLSLVCLTLVLKKPLSQYYVVNITDSSIPFTGVIEMTNLIPVEEVNGYSVVYLPKYLMADDSFFGLEDAEIFKRFSQSLLRMYPQIQSNDIIYWRVNREKYVQPLLDIGYSEKIVPMKTPLDNLFLVNTSMIHNSNLNNNQVIGLAKKMAALIREESCR